MDDPRPDLPAQRPLEKHVRIESDLFCTRCGYNLYTQPVTRDQRLDILIVRCPECGGFQPAGVASNAARVWLQRLAAMLLLLWGLFVIFVIVMGTVGLGVMQAAPVDVVTIGKHYAPDGRAVYRSWDPNTRQTIWVTEDRDVKVDVEDPEYRIALRSPAETFEEKVAVALLCCLLLVVSAVFAGTLCTLMWHVPRRWMLLTLLLPFIAGSFVIFVYHVDHDDSGKYIGLVAMIVCIVAVVQAAMMGLGLLAGRPVARVLVRMFIPPKPRQALAFLWTVDGKPPPGV